MFYGTKLDPADGHAIVVKMSRGKQARESEKPAELSELRARYMGLVAQLLTDNRDKGILREHLLRAE
jgi:hypothetical protein